MLGIRVVLVVSVLLAAACGGRAPTAPTSRAPPSTGGGPRPAPQSMAFEMTGVVTDDRGAPVSGAKVAVWLDYDLSSTFTDVSGGYKVSFTGVPGSNYVPDWDPAGTEHAVAFANAEAPGYQPHSGYILGSTPHLTENIRLHRVQRITAGESAVLTIGPDDSVCILDAWPGRELRCRTVRVVAARGGILRVEAVPTQAGSDLPGLTIYNDRAGAQGNPTSIRALEGTETIVHLTVPWGIKASQSVVVQTSLALR